MSSIRNSNSIIGVFLRDIYAFAFRYLMRKRLPTGHIGSNSHIHSPSMIADGSLKNIYLGDNVNIDWDNVIYATQGKFIMKNNSGAAVGLTVITNNHVGEIGYNFKEAKNANLVGKDIIVEEEVWIAANVTLLAGTTIGRGAIIGAGSVLAGKHVPPYSVVMGNPAKIIGYRFTPEEIIEHEKSLYPESERFPLDFLEKNYSNYYLDHIKEIKAFTSLVCKI